MSEKVLLSFFDRTGNQSQPYREAGWRVIQIDIKHGKNFLNFNIIEFLNQYGSVLPEIGIIAAMPCTAYALSGNRHKKTEARKAIFEESQQLVAHLKKIIDFLADERLLLFWQLENPSTDIHTHNKWLGKPRQKFNPCDFALYNPIDPESDRYNKRTWLFGDFRPMTSKRLEPLTAENPGWRKLGGKSERTKEQRSVTPLGFAYAFYTANH